MAASAHAWEVTEVAPSVDEWGGTPRPPVRVLWTALSRRWSLEVLLNDLAHPIGANSSGVGTTELDLPLYTDHGPKNPLGMAPKDFSVGKYLPLSASETQGLPPEISTEDAAWFEKLDQDGKYADIFVVAGHHVISEGFHNHPETDFIFTPSWLQALGRFPAMRNVFDHIKLAILWGCNTMTNLEPHGPNGEYISPEEIAEMAQDPARRASAVGSDDKNNSYRFYVDRLAREYGPDSPHYEYTLDPAKEKCLGPGKYDDCVITNLNRVLPVSGLWDETHRYNSPWVHKQIFRNAYLVLGFSSASPREEKRAVIFKTTIKRTYADLNRGLVPSDPHYVRNLFGTIVDDATPDADRRRAIEALRRQWTLTTYEMNLTPADDSPRPAGSITPYYPDLDANGVFNVVASSAHPERTPKFAPYEDPAEHERRVVP